MDDARHFRRRGIPETSLGTLQIVPRPSASAAPDFTICDAGIPVHMVAQRIGDDPATLLRSYTKRKRTEEADERLDVTIAGLTASFLTVR
jgi:hypothetical protein